jgi:hypothetical protein
MTDKHTLAPPELAERALVEELATQMALAAGYAPHCWPTWEQEATVIIPTIAKHMATRITALEAEKAELVEALERIKALTIADTWAAIALGKVGDVARATLAKVRGEA